MKKLSSIESFNIIGISVRTINSGGQAGIDIKKLWDKWFSENCSSKISNKMNDDIINLYTDYDSDEYGYYTTIVGNKVTDLESIPEGFVGKYIPATNYEKFISKGKLPECVLNTWETIWKSKNNRIYIADFDVYRLEEMNPENAIVETFVSVI
ncbi:GyrI-like domain-containing protein [Urechidicola croceus]|uniref:AraC effector-binding domain-containing protein n=1 Tax=Urechidicola croceus TaxID=1850246 RepID=A0A1D8PBK6_9FLAO|nr:effector binding domain-containing protein [Urechidicola croceus]AOW21969.1 hypothetical protein LPB138_01615 [Urechidicola croceus]